MKSPNATLRPQSPAEASTFAGEDYFRIVRKLLGTQGRHSGGGPKARMVSGQADAICSFLPEDFGHAAVPAFDHAIEGEGLQLADEVCDFVCLCGRSGPAWNAPSVIRFIPLLSRQVLAWPVGSTL